MIGQVLRSLFVKLLPANHQEPIELKNLEQIIPFQTARDIILQHPDHIAFIDCPCRVSRPNPCLPLDVCLIVGEPFASLVVEHHPDRSRWITSEEAREILEAEHARGHVHHAYFKDRMPCCAVSMPSATAAPAVVVPCRL